MSGVEASWATREKVSRVLINNVFAAAREHVFELEIAARCTGGQGARHAGDSGGQHEEVFAYAERNAFAPDNAGDAMERGELR